MANTKASTGESLVQALEELASTYTQSINDSIDSANYDLMAGMSHLVKQYGELEVDEAIATLKLDELEFEVPTFQNLYQAKT